MAASNPVHELGPLALKMECGGLRHTLQTTQKSFETGLRLVPLIQAVLNSLAACSGVKVPFITAALTRQSSFSRLGSPRERIGTSCGWWTYKSGASSRTHCQRVIQGHLGIATAVKKPGRALAYNSANSSDVIQLQEGFGFFGVLARGIHANGDVGVVADVAGIAGFST